MHRGIFARAPKNIFSATWYKIISTLTTINVVWKIDYTDCLSDIKLQDGVYTYNELMRILRMDPDIFFARAMTVPIDNERNFEIITKDDYLANAVQSLVLCVDGGSFEVFSKNDELLERLFASLSEENMEELCWIDESFDGRMDFRI